MLSRPVTVGTLLWRYFLKSKSRYDFLGKHRFVMGSGSNWWDSENWCGAAPIETSEGWLLFTMVSPVHVMGMYTA